MPFNGAYAMSKHAIEAYSDSAAQRAHVPRRAVIKIQPGLPDGMVTGIEPAFPGPRDSTYFKTC